MLAIVAVVAILYEALGSSNTSTAVSDVSQIQANVYQLYSATPNSTTAIAQSTAADVIGAGVIPSGMKSSTTTGSGSSATTSATILDPWGGTVGVGTTPTSNAVLALTFPKVPMGACAKLVVGAAKAGASVVVGSNTVYPGDSSMASDAATACSAAGGSTVAMTFNFYPSSGASNAAGSSS